VVVFEASESGALEDDEVKHYDADVLVLTVVVYVALGLLTVITPAMFGALEWGAQASPCFFQCWA